VPQLAQRRIARYFLILSALVLRERMRITHLPHESVDALAGGFGKTTRLFNDLSLW
jgi:hypothetical protein